MHNNETFNQHVSKDQFDKIFDIKISQNLNDIFAEVRNVKITKRKV